MSEYTTIALTDEDKTRLDRLADQHLEDENVSYRTIVNYLADEFEERQDDYEYVLAKAIAGADEEDAERVVNRVESDKEFVQNLNDE
jgi:predicted transcriptional regulator